MTTSSSEHSSNSDKNIDNPIQLFENPKHFKYIHFDEKEFENIVTRLLSIGTYRLDELDENEENMMEKYYKIVVLFQNTLIYPKLCSIVKKAFKTLKEIEHGTVAASCIGILTNITKDETFDQRINNPPSGYDKSNSTAKTVDSDSRREPNFNQENVYTGFYKQGVGYHFTAIRNVNSSHGHIFIKCLNWRLFPGFSLREKRELDQKGIKTITLWGDKDPTGTTNNVNFVKLFFGLLKDVKTRVPTKNPIPKNESESNNLRKKKDYLFVIVVLIIVILILTLILYSDDPS